jgi:hypothetical protein
MSLFTRQVTGSKVDRALLLAFIGASGASAIIGRSANNVWLFWLLCIACVVWGLLSLRQIVIAAGSSNALVHALTSLTTWARKKWLLKCLIVLACVATAYVGTFSYWWLTSPLEVMRTPDGTQVHVRKIRTRSIAGGLAETLDLSIWDPAFWYMVHVRGYRYYGFIAAFEDSAWVYGK